MHEEDIPKSCAECTHTYDFKRKYEVTKHCKLSEIDLDVTHITPGRRAMLCPLTKK